MKRFIYISTIFLMFSLFLQAQTQNQGARLSRGGDRNKQQQTETNKGLPELSVRAQILNEQLTQEIGKAKWMRVIYREIDLTKEKNAPLYYPVQELNGSVNLFTSLFRLVSEGKINVYKYLPDYESFDEENLLTFKDMLENFNIYFEEIPAGGGQNARYVINESDIPSSEVRTYYVKEAWFFDQNNSVYDVKTLAICPIAYMITDIGEQRTPMFWALYEDVRPYIKNNYIMTSNINNAKTYTYDDYFRQRMFDGQIVKTENLLNLALQQYCPTPDSLYLEQQRIEKQLVSFNDSLWIPQDTTILLSKKEAKKVKQTEKDKGAVSDDTKKSVRNERSSAKAPKQKESKATKSSPSRSIRR
jgi:gliding motility associated protien GldN